MTQTLKARIEIRHGNQEDLPVSGGNLFEPFFCEDTGALAIWTGTKYVFYRPFCLIDVPSGLLADRPETGDDEDNRFYYATDTKQQFVWSSILNRWILSWQSSS